MLKALLLCILCTGCAQTMPAAGASLTEISRAYTLLCGPDDALVLAAQLTARTYPEVARQVDDATKARAEICPKFRDGLNTVIDIYTEVNEVAK